MLMQTAFQWEPDDKHRQVILALTPAIELGTPVRSARVPFSEFAIVIQCGWRRRALTWEQHWRLTRRSAAPSGVGRHQAVRWDRSYGLSGGSPSARCC